MTFLLPLLTLTSVLTLATPSWAQQEEEPGLRDPVTIRPLNLSLPPQPHGSALFAPSPQGHLGQGGDLLRLPDLGTQTSGQRGRLPYGSGYEARQQTRRAMASPSIGIGSGSGFGGNPDGGFGSGQGAVGDRGMGGRR